MVQITWNFYPIEEIRYHFVYSWFDGHRLTISGQEKSREMYEECHKTKVGENEYRQMKNVSIIAHSRNDRIIKSIRPLESS